MGSAVGQGKSDSSGLKPSSVPASSDPKPPASDVWVALPTRTYDHMAKVTRDAQSLLDALQANIDDLRTGFNGEAPAGQLDQGLRDIETCCERLNDMLEDALVGVRRDGLTIQRSSVSIASVVAAAMKHVRTTAESRRISIAVTAEPDVAARLDRTLLTRALAKLMGRIMAESETGAEISVSYRLERGEIRLSLVSSSAGARANRTSLRPREDVEADLEFCHLVAECHGGTLTIGTDGGPTYRFDLPWVG
jgi:K+-sensing histidine kinase KdpD